MKSEKKSCSNCYGMGQLENGNAGPFDCPACRGNGYIEIIKRVDHYDVAKKEKENGLENK